MIYLSHVAVSLTPLISLTVSDLLGHLQHLRARLQACDVERDLLQQQAQRLRSEAAAARRDGEDAQRQLQEQLQRAAAEAWRAAERQAHAEQLKTRAEVTPPHTRTPSSPNAYTHAHKNLTNAHVRGAGEQPGAEEAAQLEVNRGECKRAGGAEGEEESWRSAGSDGRAAQAAAGCAGREEGVGGTGVATYVAVTHVDSDVPAAFVSRRSPC